MNHQYWTFIAFLNLVLEIGQIIFLPDHDGSPFVLGMALFCFGVASIIRAIERLRP